MSKEYLEAKPEDIVKLLYEVYDVPSGICEHIKNMQQRLEAIDNSKPSEAMDSLKQIEDVIETKIGLGVVNTYIINIIKQALQRLETIDNANPNELTLKELVSKHIVNPNSVVDVYEQDKNNPHYSNRIFMGMAWEMEKHEIGNRKLKYIFSATAETISESDRVCIEVLEDE